MMKLTKATDFTIRLLVFLAKEGGVVKTNDLSKSINVSYHHLTKIIQKLAKSQIIRTQKSKYGGIALLKPIDKITLKEIINLMDGPLLLSDCQQENSFCSFMQNCKLKSIFDGLEMNINGLLDNVKLKDMI